MSDCTIERDGFGRYTIIHKSSSVTMEVQRWRDTLYLYYFMSKDREQGHGTQVLNMCRRIARRMGKPLELTAAPFMPYGEKPYHIERLKSFYEKRGFKVVEDHGRTAIMVYNPN